MPGRSEGVFLEDTRVVLVRPRFPENIGMAARACANMGISRICLVEPELWEAEHQAKALSLATTQGENILREVSLAATLAEAVADCNFVLGTTARTGGWRRHILSPECAGEETAERLVEGAKAALVFGPEDRGLLNEEIELCTALATVSTALDAASLNLAQAVLIIAYECGKAAAQGSARAPRATPEAAANLISHAEQELLFAAIAKTLKTVDFLPQDNSDYFLLPVRRFVHDSALKRGEFSMLMGICRQIMWKAGAKDKGMREDGP